jgi:UDP-glucose 4-epimerase
MKYVVTGGAGFIGSHIVDLLISEGYSVLVIDNLSTGILSNVNPKADLHIDSMGNIESLSRVLRGYDGVFHAAALPRIQPSFERPLEHHEANVNITLNLLLAMSKVGCNNLVYSSSSSCYGNPSQFPTPENADIRPLNPYALQKYVSEQYALILSRTLRIKVIALRYFNVYGDRSFNIQNPFNAYSSVIGIFENAKRLGRPLQITGTGNQKRDFIHVSDIARANLLAMISNVPSDVFNLGCGSPISILSIANFFSNNIKFIPARQGEAEITWACIDKISSILKWEPLINTENYLKKFQSSL